MGALALLGRETKSLYSAVKSLPFSRSGGNAYGGSYGGNWNGSNSMFLGGTLPGAQHDYQSAAGVLWENPSAAACFVALTKAFAQARPILEKRTGKNWELVEKNPLISLLSKPNNFYSGEKLFGVTLISAMSNGAGFWRLERNRTGVPSEIWFEPPVGTGPTGIAPTWDATDFIKEYIYFVDGKRHETPLKREDVVYFRHGLNVANPRLPWAPLGLAAREITTLNGASTYTSALMRNSAVPSGMLSVDSGVTGIAPTPDQALEMKAKIKAGFKGENVGEPFISSTPWKWTPFNWSPSELSIDKLRSWPQGTVCALLGTPEDVALLPTGERPTYQNLDAAMRWWWDHTIIPLEDAFADEIETQLFEAFDLDTDDYRMAWDRSRVPALREDEIAKYGMIGDSYKSGILDLFDARTALSLEADDEMKGVRHPLATPKPEGTDAPTTDDIQKQNQVDAARKNWDESQHQRADDGKFGSGGGKQPKKSTRTPEPVLSEKALRAKAAHVMVDKDIQRYAEEHNEPRFAKAMGGVSFPDSEPIDVAVPNSKGVVTHGIELKTVVKNSNAKITMKGAAMEKKANWEKNNKATVHTVVFDDTAVKDAKGAGKHDESKRKIFYRRGYGSFRIGSMHPVKDLSELKTLLNTPNEKLPMAAQRKVK